MPDIIGSDGNGRDEISVGLWPITVEARAEISRKSGIPLNVIARWFDADFGPEAATSAALAAVVDEVRVAALAAPLRWRAGCPPLRRPMEFSEDQARAWRGSASPCTMQASTSRRAQSCRKPARRRRRWR